jgi:hypothetical protein
MDSSKLRLEVQNLLEINHLFEEHRIKLIVDSGWAFDENDLRDVTALCERFNISLPQEYREHTSSII